MCVVRYDGQVLYMTSKMTGLFVLMLLEVVLFQLKRK